MPSAIGHARGANREVHPRTACGGHGQPSVTSQRSSDRPRKNAETRRLQPLRNLRRSDAYKSGVMGCAGAVTCPCGGTNEHAGEYDKYGDPATHIHLHISGRVQNQEGQFGLASACSSIARTSCSAVSASRRVSERGTGGGRAWQRGSAQEGLLGRCLEFYRAAVCGLTRAAT